MTNKNLIETTEVKPYRAWAKVDGNIIILATLCNEHWKRPDYIEVEIRPLTSQGGEEKCEKVNIWKDRFDLVHSALGCDDATVCEVINKAKELKAKSEEPSCVDGALVLELRNDIEKMRDEFKHMSREYFELVHSVGCGLYETHEDVVKRALEFRSKAMKKEDKPFDKEEK